MRRVLLGYVLSVVAVAGIVTAPIACAQAPTIPNTAAGTVLRAWLDAFNSGDSARMEAYYQKYQPDQNAAGQLRFRDQTGGFDLLTIEHSDPSRLLFTVKEHKSETTAFGMIEVVAESIKVTGFRLQAMGPNVSASAMHIDAAERQRVIDGAIARLDEYYVFPDVAKRMGDSLHARLGRGAYDSDDNGVIFALALNDELRAISHDKHLRVDFSPHPLPPQPASPPLRTPEMIARQQAQMDAMNCGFVKAETLPDNVGYLKFNMFADPELCGATASAAMSFLAGTRALIIDMRENGGGSPAMVTYIASYLFPKRTHLNDLWNRKSGETEEFWTKDSLPGRKFGGEKPVYVLTSSRTFSGAEEFSYDLKTQKRATIVGETTGGGAHPVAGRRIDEHFIIGVPGARAINPVTHTNWEGVGVEPDVKVPAADALATAQKLLRQKTQP